MSIVAVHWHDAHAEADDQWLGTGDFIDEAFSVLTCGVMLPEVKKNHLSIARSLANGLYDHVLHIPRKMVVDVTVLGVVPPEFTCAV